MHADHVGWGWGARTPFVSAPNPTPRCHSNGLDVQTLTPPLQLPQRTRPSATPEGWGGGGQGRRDRPLRCRQRWPICFQARPSRSMSTMGWPAAWRVLTPPQRPSRCGHHGLCPFPLPRVPSKVSGHLPPGEYELAPLSAIPVDKVAGRGRAHAAGERHECYLQAGGRGVPALPGGVGPELLKLVHRAAHHLVPVRWQEVLTSQLHNLEKHLSEVGCPQSGKLSPSSRGGQVTQEGCKRRKKMTSTPQTMMDRSQLLPGPFL